MNPYRRQQPQQDLNRDAPQRHPRDVEGYIEPSEPDPSLPWVDEQYLKYLKQPGGGRWGGSFRDAFGPVSKPDQQPISQPNIAKHNRITGNKRRKGYTPPSSRWKKKQYNKKKNYISPKNRRITGKVKPKPKRIDNWAPMPTPTPIRPRPRPPWRPAPPPWIINPPRPRPRPPFPPPWMRPIPITPDPMPIIPSPHPNPHPNPMRPLPTERFPNRPDYGS